MDQPASTALRPNDGPIKPALGQRPVHTDYGCYVQHIMRVPPCVKGVVNCQNSRDKGPQKEIVPVGKPRPYSIIILNMRFIPKASLRASSQITASSYILERHL